MSTPYLMITSEAVGSWLKSEWMSVAALRKCRSRGPGVWGKLAAQQERGVLKTHSAVYPHSLSRKRLWSSPHTLGSCRTGWGHPQSQQSPPNRALDLGSVVGALLRNSV